MVIGKETIMGPLVPEVIGNELNFVVALFVGIAFGFILEQAGFSTSKKLVGLFYGYDFTVLRVFFTAGVTAMIGVVALNHFGLIDISLVYVNPTFLWSALVGGLIMGIGFVVGGYCPGTSVCAAAIGKIDAIIFVAGSFVGVLLFAEGYPLFEGLYKAANWGNVKIFEVIGVSQSLFAFLLTFVAVGAFWAVTLIENKVNGKINPELNAKPLYAGLTAIAMVIGLSAFVMPDRKGTILKNISDTEFIATQKIELMTSDELAFRLMDNDKDLQIFDFRDQKSYDEMPLPRSTRVTLESLFEKDAYKLLSLNGARNVFIASDELTATKGYLIAMRLGFKGLNVSRGGFNEFKKDMFEVPAASEGQDRQSIDTRRFRLVASVALPLLIKEFKQKQMGGNTKKVKNRVLGGC